VSGVPHTHEFSEAENRAISLLSVSLSKLALPLFVFSVVQGGSALWIYRTANPPWGEGFYPFAALVAVVSLAFWGVCVSASKQLHLIVDTEGSDIEHLMSAIVKLKKGMMLLTAAALPVLVGLFFLLFYTFVRFNFVL